VLAGVLLTCSAACALNPELDLSQYAHTPWRIRDGFVNGAISSLAQTPDGYLWLGSEFGLLRFDGVKPVAWEPPAPQALPSARIFSLLSARDGTLWIGTSKGLASWKNGSLTQYPALAGQSIRAPIIESHDGAVWAGGLASSPPGKLCSIQNGRVQCYGEDGKFDNGVSGLYEDRQHNLWVGVRNGIWRWKPGPPKFFPAPGPAAGGGGIQGFAETDDGALLFGPRTGISRIVGERVEPFPLPGAGEKVANGLTATRILRDKDGNLWIGTADGGLVHVHRGKTNVFAQSDGLSGDFVLALLADREGSIWVGTAGGLDRFRDFAVPTFSLKQGLSNASILSVLADRDGGVWLSTRRGLNRWNGDRITVFGNGRSDGLLNGNYAGTLFQDSAGRIWASTLREFGYLDHDRFVPLSVVPGGAVYSITEDAARNLWIANRNRGLIQLAKSGQVHETPWVELGHKDPALALAVDPRRGGLWIGFQQGGIQYFDVARALTRGESFSAERDGLGGGRINDLRFDPDGTLWIATEGGLSRLKNGRVTTWNSKNGLPCDSVHWVMEDNSHSFWLYTICGLVSIRRSELEDAGQKDIHGTLFDISDGVRTLEDNGGYTPHVARAPDGKLWFLPSDGASIVDPAHIPYNRLPPPVRIVKIIADRREYQVPSDDKGNVRLPPLVRDLEIDYSALSLVVPEKVLFRYKLEGWDRDWQDVANRRQAWYSNLPPRGYRFRVAACNNSGLWNETGASFDFSIAPAYYQAAWFQLSCVATLLGLLWAGYRYRLREFNLRMEERLDERTRIARDLHDTLLQSFQGVLMKFSAFSYRLKDHLDIQKDFDVIVEQARGAVVEGREAVMGLRSSTVVTNELAEAIRSLAAELPSQSVELQVVVEGPARPLSPLVRDEVYRIACEAVRNAGRHADAGRVDVLIQYHAIQFRMRVRDNGKGIEPGILSEGQRAGHHGLQGMRERAKVIGGKLALSSKPASGTEVELTVPGAIAYGNQPSPARTASAESGEAH
jgi:signal transduction histidine kinase/ligand-binding sensor domain-containing protein